MNALDSAWLRERSLPRTGDGGKEERGKVFICGGQHSLAGAVLLAGEASLRAGAGKVTVSVAASATTALTLALPEARVCALPDRFGEADGPDEAFVAGLAACDALLVGPGLIGDDTGIARIVIEQSPDVPMVIDAGALSALASLRVSPKAVLTPHAGEMARLLDEHRDAIVCDPLAAATRAAERFGCVVIMKGPETILAAPDRQPLRYAGGGPGLGTSGSGDVLAGLIVGLMARGTTSFEAAAWGVYLHGEAGMRLAGKIGPLGYLAREIAVEVPAIMAGFVS